jgi:CHAT domain-containing protein
MNTTRFFVLFILLPLGICGQSLKDRYLPKFDSLYTKARNYPEALQLARTWEAEACATLGKRSLERAVALTRLGRYNYEITQNFAAADTAFVLAEDITIEAGADNTNEFGLLLLLRGNLLRGQSKFTEALSYFDRSRAIRLKLFGTDNIYTLTSQSYLALGNADLGRLHVAEKLFLANMSAYERMNMGQSTGYQFALNQYAQTLADQGQFTKAIELGQRNMELCRKLYVKQEDIYNKNLFSLGRTYLMANKLEEAEPIFREIISSYTVEKYKSYNALGATQLKLGLWEEAESNIGRYQAYLMQRDKDILGIEYAATSVNLGAAYYKKGDFAKADSVRQYALWIYSEILGDTSRQYLNVLLECAYAGVRHDKPAKAQASLNSIERQHMNYIHADPEMLEHWYYIKGYLAYRNGDYENAYDFFKKCLELNSTGSGSYRNNLKMNALALYKLHRFSEAQSMLHEFVAIEKVNTQRNFRFLSDYERFLVAQNLQEARDLLGSMQFETSDIKQETDLLDLDLFCKNILETTTRKTQAFVQHSGDSSLVELYKKWLNVREQLNYYERKSQAVIAENGIDLKVLGAELERLEKEISRKGVPRIQSANQQDWTKVRDALGPDEAAVDVMRFQLVSGEQYRDTVVYAIFVIRPDDKQVQLMFLENGNELESFVMGQYQNEITRKKDLSPVLYQKIWAQIALKLQGVKTLYFSPDGIFHKINLNTLRTANGAYLIENLSIRQVANLQNLLEKNQDTASPMPATAALFGNPDFNNLAENNSPRSSSERSLRTNTLRDLQQETGNDFQLDPLPGSAREVRNIAQKLNAQNWKTSVFTDALATEDTLKSLKSPNVLHIATHGYFLNSEKTPDANGFMSAQAGKNPAFRSMLFLAGAENTIKNAPPTGPNDGILTAYEASVLDLDKTDLVVLSACNTGLGKIQNGEGVLGLQRAFRIAGAKSLIMSLWEVDDSATELLMNAFYENWLAGMSKSDAFRKAQLAVKAKFPQPFYWGGFILVNG